MVAELMLEILAYGDGRIEVGMPIWCESSWWWLRRCIGVRLAPVRHGRWRTRKAVTV
jgi:hypothetical protein